MIGACMMVLTQRNSPPERMGWDLWAIPREPLHGVVGLSLGEKGADVSVGSVVDVPAGTALRISATIKQCVYQGWYDLYDCLIGARPHAGELTVEALLRERPIGSIIDPPEPTHSSQNGIAAVGNISEIRFGQGTSIVSIADPTLVRIHVEDTPVAELSFWTYDLRSWEESSTYLWLPLTARSIDAKLPGLRITADGLARELSFSLSPRLIWIRHDSTTLSGSAAGGFGKVLFDRLPQSLEIRRASYKSFSKCNNEYQWEDVLTVDAWDAPWGSTIEWTQQASARNFQGSLSLNAFTGVDLTVDPVRDRYVLRSNHVDDSGGIDVSLKWPHGSDECGKSLNELSLQGERLTTTDIVLTPDQDIAVELWSTMALEGYLHLVASADLWEALGSEVSGTFGLDRRDCFDERYEFIVPFDDNPCLEEGSCHRWAPPGVKDVQLCALDGGAE